MKGPFKSSVRISCLWRWPDTVHQHFLWYMGYLSKDGDNVSILWGLEPRTSISFLNMRCLIPSQHWQLHSGVTVHTTECHGILLNKFSYKVGGQWASSGLQPTWMPLIATGIKAGFPYMFCDDPEWFTMVFASPWSWIDPTNALQDKVQALLRKLCGALYSIATAILILWSAAKNRTNNLSSWIPLLTLLIVQHRYWSLYYSWMNLYYCMQ